MNVTCLCSDVAQECSSLPKEYEPLSQITITNDTIVDITGLNFSGYILMTSKDYIGKRYMY